MILSTVASGSDSSLQGEIFEVVDNSASWEKLWRSHAPAGQPPVPVIDFASDMVVCVWAGTRSTGGHSVDIHRVEETAEGLNVHVQAKEPAAGQMVTQALTQPHHCVRCRASSRRPARLLWTKAAPPLDRPVTMMVGLREGTDVDDMAGQVK